MRVREGEREGEREREGGRQIERERERGRDRECSVFVCTTCSHTDVVVTNLMLIL